MPLHRRAVLATGVLAMMGSKAFGNGAPKVLHDGPVMADYFQIFLRDESDARLPTDYSEDVIARRLMVGPRAVVLHTLRNMPVPLRVEWSEGRPPVDSAAHQHIVEAGLACPSGRLVLAGMTDYEPAAPRLTVKAGPIGIRFCLSGLDTLSPDGLAGDDRYLVQLWSGPEAEEVRVIKAWPSR
jgi:hypothetical protein